MRLFLALLISLIVSEASAQDAAPKYWVFFDAKPAFAGKAPQVTGEALIRRSRRGTQVPSRLDWPVSPAYLAEVRAIGLEPLVESRWLNAVSVRLTSEELESVSRLPFVTQIRPVGSLTSETVPQETHFGRTESPLPSARRLDYGGSFTQLDVVRAIPGLEAGINADGVRLGIIDTGAGDLEHPAVRHIKLDNRLAGQRDFTGQPDDGSRHALAVLSVAAGFDEGNLIGPAYGATIYLARTEYAPTETNQEEDNFVAGIEWMEAQGVDVVNISLGYSEFDAGQNDYTYQDMDGDTAITTRAADLAARLGVTVVNSAGNYGSQAWHYITSPADGDSVITVGAVASNYTVTAFSGRGPTSDGRIKPDVSAMGTRVVIAASSAYSSNGQGTSFSSPMVAGVAAQLLQVNPDLAPMEVREILRRTATQTQEPNNAIGWGVIDAEAALALAAIWSTSVEDEPGLPARAQAFPNPSAGRTRLQLDLAAASPAEIVVVDLLGREVGRTSWSSLPAGRNLIVLPLPDDAAAGWYGYRVQTADVTLSGSITRVR